MKKRYELITCTDKYIHMGLKDYCLNSKQIVSMDRLVDLLNEQDQKIKKLEQSQNSKAIEVLNEIRYNLCSKYTTIFDNNDEPIKILEINQIFDFLNNQIKELKGVK